MNIELGPVNKILYGILLSITIIMMIAYVIWLLKLVFEDCDIEWKDKWSTFKEKVQRKWYETTNKIKKRFA